MSCDFPRCECLCHPDNCVFLDKNRKKGRTMNDQTITRTAEEQVTDEVATVVAVGEPAIAVVGDRVIAEGTFVEGEDGVIYLQTEEDQGKNDQQIG